MQAVWLDFDFVLVAILFGMSVVGMSTTINWSVENASCRGNIVTKSEEKAAERLRLCCSYGNSLDVVEWNCNSHFVVSATSVKKVWWPM
jgi:hypothetical protein